MVKVEFSKDEASKKEEKGHWHDDAILLLRPESSGFRFLVQIRAFDLAGITKLKKKNVKGKYEKDSGRSSKVTPSCKCVVFVDKSALKNSLVVYKGFLGLLYVLSSTTTPPP